jgi:thiamine pyrophosphokinase
MKNALVFANGEMVIPPGISQELQDPSFVVAADGGTNHCKTLGVTPDVIIGDMDSMMEEEIRAYESAGVKVIRHPARKDETDLELALGYVQQAGITDVTILGGLGGRWDMTLANLLLFAHPRLRPLNIRFVDGTHELFLVKPGIRSRLTGKPGDVVSLIPLFGNVEGITTLGLEYPLNDESLAFGATRGVSNVLVQEQAEVNIRQGHILCVINRVP